MEELKTGDSPSYKTAQIWAQTENKNNVRLRLSMQCQSHQAFFFLTQKRLDKNDVGFGGVFADFSHLADLWVDKGQMQHAISFNQIQSDAVTSFRVVLKICILLELVLNKLSIPIYSP